MSKNDCGPGGRTPDEWTTQVDECTMQNNRRDTSNDRLTMANVFEKASQMQKKVLDGIPSVKEKLCGMWNAIAAYARWRSEAAIDAVLKSSGLKSIASTSKTGGRLETLNEKLPKSPLNARFIGDAHGAEDIFARRNLAANRTLSVLIALASYAWVCIFLAWMVAEILASVCRIDMPEIGDQDQDHYKSYVNQCAMKLQTVVATIIPPFYLVSSVLVAILFTNVILLSAGFKSVIPPHSSTTVVTTVSSIPSAIPTPLIPNAWVNRATAWIRNVAATCISKVRSIALSWWSSKLMATICLLVFWALYTLSIWSYGVAATMDPGFLPENERPYTGDPSGYDHFIPNHTSSISDVLGRSHASGTSSVFDSAHTMDSTLGSFYPIATSQRTENLYGNVDRMINMKERYLSYLDDEETRLWVAKQWEGSASSANNERAAEHDESASKPIRRSKWNKNPKAPPILLENGVSNTLVNDMATINTTTARVSNPSHNSFDKESPDLDIEGEISDVDISLNFGENMDVRDTKRPIAIGEERKTKFNHKPANYAITGKSGEFTGHHLSLYDTEMLYNMAVNHYNSVYFDTVFSDNDRMLASGILETSEFTNYIHLNSTAYVAGSNSTGYVNSAGRGSTGHMNDSAGYIHRHVGMQPVDYDPRRYVQTPIKQERVWPIQYNPTRPIQYDPFRRIFVPYGARYSGIHGKYVVGLQTDPPLMMKWISGFIGNPIGFRNQKAFSLFLLYSGMLSWYVLIILGGKMLGLIWDPKSPALIGAKESKSVDESLNHGLLQKSSPKEQMSPETDEDLTKKSTKNEVKISISESESNITDNNYVTTEVGFDTTSTIVSLKINYLFKSYYLNFVVLGWCLLHGICSVYMMQNGLWNGQHVFWNTLDNGIGSPYTGNVRGIVCSFLPHEACSERNAIQDYIMANKGAALAAIQDPDIEYPSSVSNHAHTSSQRVSISRSFLQKMDALTRVPVEQQAWVTPQRMPQRMQQAQAVQPLGPGHTPIPPWAGVPQQNQGGARTQEPVVPPDCPPEKGDWQLWLENEHLKIFKSDVVDKYSSPYHRFDANIFIFENDTPRWFRSPCEILTDGKHKDTGLHKAFNNLHKHCRSVLLLQRKTDACPVDPSFRSDLNAKIKDIFKDDTVGDQNLLGEEEGWLQFRQDTFRFEPVAMGGMGGAYRFSAPSACADFVVKVQFLLPEASECGQLFQKCLEIEQIASRLQFLRSRNPQFLLIPQPPMAVDSGVGNVLFLPFASGGAVSDTLQEVINTGDAWLSDRRNPKPDCSWFSTFFRSLVPLMYIIDDMMFPQHDSEKGLVHRDIKPPNMVFTSTKSKDARVALIDWDLLIPVQKEGVWDGGIGTPNFIPYSFQLLHDGKVTQFTGRSHDEFALMVTAAVVMLGRLDPPCVLVTVVLTPEDETQAPKSDVHTLIDLLKQSSGYSSRFPRTKWGDQIQQTDQERINYLASWSDFLQSYLRLWAQAENPNLSCFKNIHRDLTLRKIYEISNVGDVAIAEQLLKNVSPYTSQCIEDWGKAHVNLLEIVTEYPNVFGGGTVPEYNNEFKREKMSDDESWFHKTFGTFF